MSWYRQYRPQTVAGLHISTVRESFQRILDLGDYVHAYLLTGPKGTGKTSGARILAKLLNCEVNRNVITDKLSGKASKGAKLAEPCNSCPICTAITKGSSFCVLEMDGASNRGIEDIRELSSKIGLSAGDGAINVVIIDEVHMLTTEAFNALLKVLEEPPAHVVFVLATTDVQKMPATVVSRCQVVSYRKALPSELADSLSQIAKSEGIEVEPEVFSQIADYADGSFRDGVKVFEQIAKGKKKVSVPDVAMVLGKSVRELSEKLLKFLGKRDINGVSAFFTELNLQGIDLLILQKEVLKSLHERMLSASASQNPHLLTYVSLLKLLNVPPSMVLPAPGLPFEIACLEWCLAKKATVAVSSREVEVKAKPKTKIENEIETQVPPSDSSLELRKKKEVIVEEEVVDDAPDLDVEYSVVISRWHDVLRSMRDVNPSLEALFKTSKPIKLENKVLSLEVYYQFHKEQLESTRNFVLIKDVLRKLFSSKIRPEFLLTEKAAASAESNDSNLSGIVDLSFVKAAEEAFLS